MNDRIERPVEFYIGIEHRLVFNRIKDDSNIGHFPALAIHRGLFMSGSPSIRSKPGEQARERGPEQRVFLDGESNHDADQQQPEDVALALGGVGLAQAVIQQAVENIGEKPGNA